MSWVFFFKICFCVSFGNELLCFGHLFHYSDLNLEKIDLWSFVLIVITRNELVISFVLYKLSDFGFTGVIEILLSIISNWFCTHVSRDIMWHLVEHLLSINYKRLS